MNKLQKNANVKINNRYVLMLMGNVFQSYVLLFRQKCNVYKHPIVVIGVLKKKMIILPLRNVLKNVLK